MPAMIPQRSATLTVGSSHYKGIAFRMEPDGLRSPARKGVISGDTSVLSEAAWAGVVTLSVNTGDDLTILVSRYRKGDRFAEVEVLH